MASVATVGAAVLTEIEELANQAWRYRAAGLGGRFRALFGAVGRRVVVPIRVAPLGVR